MTIEKEEDLKRWIDYRQRFSNQAKREGFSKEYIDRCLDYAQKLHQNNLPIIFSQDHLAALVGYNVEYLRRCTNDQGSFYRTYNIPKRSGGTRLIDEPLPSLKEIQRWILDNILCCFSIHACAKAFRNNTSIKDNARFHRKQRVVISIDLKDFFPSLSAKRVFRLLYKAGYSEPVALMITKLCCLRGSLPQGAPTSPMLSNILFFKLDERIFGFCTNRKLRYTRYADDITVSGNIEIRPGKVIRFVKNAVESNGLRVNEKKTRVLQRHQRQEVTGLVVNETVQLPRHIRRKIRSDAYFIEKYGVESQLLRAPDIRRNYQAHLYGWARFALFIDPNNRDAKKLRELVEVDKFE